MTAATRVRSQVGERIAPTVRRAKGAASVRGRRALVRVKYPQVEWGNTLVRGPLRIVGGGKLILEPGVSFADGNGENFLSIDEGATVRIGAHTFLNGVSIFAEADVSIGADNLLSDVWITTTNMHTATPERRRDRPTARPITIGANVWLASRVVVLPGVTIGDDSVVSIGTVVSEDVPPRSVVTSHQQQVIRTFDGG